MTKLLHLMVQPQKELEDHREQYEAHTQLDAFSFFQLCFLVSVKAEFVYCGAQFSCMFKKQI